MSKQENRWTAESMQCATVSEKIKRMEADNDSVVMAFERQRALNTLKITNCKSHVFKNGLVGTDGENIVHINLDAVMFVSMSAKSDKLWKSRCPLKKSASKRQT